MINKQWQILNIYLENRWFWKKKHFDPCLFSTVVFFLNMFFFFFLNKMFFFLKKTLDVVATLFSHIHDMALLLKGHLPLPQRRDAVIDRRVFCPQTPENRTQFFRLWGAREGQFRAHHWGEALYHFLKHHCSHQKIIPFFNLRFPLSDRAASIQSQQLSIGMVTYKQMYEEILLEQTVDTGQSKSYIVFSTVVSVVCKWPTPDQIASSFDHWPDTCS